MGYVMRSMKLFATGQGQENSELTLQPGEEDVVVSRQQFHLSRPRRERCWGR